MTKKIEPDKLYRPLGPPIGGIQSGNSGMGGGPNRGPGPQGLPYPNSGYPQQGPSMGRGGYPQQGGHGFHQAGVYDNRGGNPQGGNTTVVVNPANPQVIYGGVDRGYSGGDLALGMLAGAAIGGTLGWGWGGGHGNSLNNLF